MAFDNNPKIEILEENKKERFGFKLYATKDKYFNFYLDSKEEMQDWVQKIETSAGAQYFHLYDTDWKNCRTSCT